MEEEKEEEEDDAKQELVYGRPYTTYLVCLLHKRNFFQIG